MGSLLAEPWASVASFQTLSKPCCKLTPSMLQTRNLDMVFILPHQLLISNAVWPIAYCSSVLSVLRMAWHDVVMTAALMDRLEQTALWSN